MSNLFLVYVEGAGFVPAAECAKIAPSGQSPGEPMPAGRPTDYRTEYCDRVVEFGRMGKSLTWMAAELGIAKSTLQLWEKDIPEFSVAMTQARALSQKWWEDMGQDYMLMSPGQGTFNASVWSRSMAARFPEDWRENKGVEVSGSLNLAGELAALNAKAAE